MCEIYSTSNTLDKLDVLKITVQILFSQIKQHIHNNITVATIY